MAAPLPELGLSYRDAVVAFKRRLIRAVLDQVGGNRRRAAKVLCLQRTYLVRLMRDLDLREGSKGPTDSRINLPTAPQHVLGLVWLNVESARVCLGCEAVFSAHLAMCPSCQSIRTTPFVEHERSMAAARVARTAPAP